MSATCLVLHIRRTFPGCDIRSHFSSHSSGRGELRLLDGTLNSPTGATLACVTPRWNEKFRANTLQRRYLFIVALFQRQRCTVGYSVYVLLHPVNCTQGCGHTMPVIHSTALQLTSLHKDVSTHIFASCSVLWAFNADHDHDLESKLGYSKLEMKFHDTKQTWKPT